MKKLLLASAALALSSTFAFAFDFGVTTTTTTTTSSGGSTPPNLLQSFTYNGTIGDTGGKKDPTNFLKATQTQFAIGGTTPTLSQTGNVTQTIGNSTGGHAANKAIVNQTQFSISNP